MRKPQFIYFQVTCETTPSNLRKQYLELCKLYHPDIGGNADTFREMKEEYPLALNYLKYLAELKINSNDHCKTQYKLDNSIILKEINRMLDDIQNNPQNFNFQKVSNELKTIGLKAGIGFIQNLIR